jgi:hypothetical protein
VRSLKAAWEKPETDVTPQLLHDHLTGIVAKIP